MSYYYRFELFKKIRSETVLAPSLQIAPLYRPEKLVQFGDLVQFGVMQFGSGYCNAIIFELDDRGRHFKLCGVGRCGWCGMKIGTKWDWCGSVRVPLRPDPHQLEPDPHHPIHRQFDHSSRDGEYFRRPL